ncbi:MAG: MaoC family dehydratase, partial [Deltaproteobacteria bacterium]
MSDAIATRRFSSEDQRRFARLSGDANPIHGDPLAARRSIFGEPVVHGVHLLLWSLGALARQGLARGGVSGLDVRFPGPTFLGDEVTLRLQVVSSTEVKVKASVGARTVAVIGLGLTGSPPGPTRDDGGEGDRNLVPAGLPEDRQFGALAGSRGDV